MVLCWPLSVVLCGVPTEHHCRGHRLQMCSCHDFHVLLRYHPEPFQSCIEKWMKLLWVGTETNLLCCLQTNCYRDWNEFSAQHGVLEILFWAVFPIIWAAGIPDSQGKKQWEQAQPVHGREERAGMGLLRPGNNFSSTDTRQGLFFFACWQLLRRWPQNMSGKVIKDRQEAWL